jgi:hypothetical protein
VSPVQGKIQSRCSINPVELNSNLLFCRWNVPKLWWFLGASHNHSIGKILYWKCD